MVELAKIVYYFFHFIIIISVGFSVSFMAIAVIMACAIYINDYYDRRKRRKCKKDS